MTLILKNTFFDIEEPGEKIHARRSSSAPPTWKPLDNCNTLLSDISTADTDDEVSFVTPPSVLDGDGQISDHACPNTELQKEGSDCTHEGSESINLNAESPSSSKWTLCLDATVTCYDADGMCASWFDVSQGDEAPVKGKRTLCLNDTVTSTIGVPEGAPKTKLSSKARMFAPVSTVSEEIISLIETVRESLQSSPDVLSVKVSDGAMGGTTTVLAEVRSSGFSLGAATILQMLCIIKSTLLGAAEASETAYILGYGSQPFQDINCGFQCTVGCVTPLQEHSVCWDTYEQGYCPRRNTCRWCHPMPSDLMQIVVMLKELA